MTTSHSLDAEVRKLSDRAEITDLVYRYAMGISERDTEMLLSIFAADVHLDFDYEIIDGIDAARTYFGTSQVTSTRGPIGFNQVFSSTPLIANILIDLDGDQAHAESRGFVVHHGERDNEELFVMRSLHFSDDFVRTEDGWRIKSRRHPHPAWMLELRAQDPRRSRPPRAEGTGD